MLLKFWFAPAVTAAVFAVIQLVGFGFYAGHVGDFTAVGGLFVYAMVLWLIPAFKGFFEKYAGSWTVIALLSAGALCKIADRLHGNLAKYGIQMPRESAWFSFFELMEESLEMMLPYLGIIAVLQFRADKKLFYPRGK